MVDGRIVLSIFVLVALGLAGCAEVRAQCPDGTDVARKIYSGGSEAEWCRRGDGVREGPELRFYESGRRMIEGAYADGARQGAWRYFFNQGSAWRQDRWEEGALLEKAIDPRVRKLSAAELDALGRTSTGVVKLAATDPLLGRAARERPGRSFVDLYQNGGARAAGSYDADGLRTGTWRSWYENGRPQRELEFEAGVRHRGFREWHETGAPKTDGFYVDGERDGHWRRWDDSGRAITADGRGSDVMVAP